MKTRFMSLFLSMALIVVSLPIAVASVSQSDTISSYDIWDGKIASCFASGDGSQTNPYLITSSEELAYLANQVNLGNSYKDSFFKQMVDLDLNNIQWTPIGNEEYRFSGRYDGNSHYIKSLNINNQKDYQGLFGISDGILMNMNVINSAVTAKSYVGIIAGSNIGDNRVGQYNIGKILNCKVENCEVTGQNFVGGLIGNAKGDIYQCCCVSSNVNGNDYVGGIAGAMYHKENTCGAYNKMMFDTCISYDSVVNGNKYIGGICGYKKDGNGSIGAYIGYFNKCMNINTNVSGNESVGGVIGFSVQFYSADRTMVSDCVNTGDVYSNLYAGGIVGGSNGTVGFYPEAVTNIEQCANIGIIKANNNIYGAIACPRSNGDTKVYTSKSDYYLSGGRNSISATALTSDMFLKRENFEGWDFNNTWTINTVIGCPVIKEMYHLIDLGDVYCRIGCYDAVSLNPIKDVKISFEVDGSVLGYSNEDGRYDFKTDGNVFFADVDIRFEAEGYEIYRCKLSDLIATFELDLLRENIILLSTDENIDDTTLFVNNHILYIKNGNMTKNNDFSFYNYVWKNEEENRSATKMLSYNSWKMFDKLDKVVTFKWNDLILEANEYELWISDLIISMANSVTEEEVKVTYNKEYNELYKRFSSYFDLFVTQNDIEDIVKEVYGNVNGIYNMTPEEIAYELLKFKVEVKSSFFEGGKLSKTSEQILSKFYEEIKGEAYSDWFFGIFDGIKEINDFVNNFLQASNDIVNVFVKSRNAYLTIKCLKSIVDDMDVIMDEVYVEMHKQNDKVADGIKEAYKKWREKVNLNDSELWRKCLNEKTVEEMVDIIYSTFIKDYMKEVCYTGIAYLLLKGGVQLEIVATFVNDLKVSTAACSAMFSFLDKVTKNGERVDCYFNIEYGAIFEQALSVVVNRKAQEVISNKALKSVQEFETAFHYWKELNKYCYEKCYEYNSEYAFDLAFSESEKEKKREQWRFTLDDMSSKQYYWNEAFCHNFTPSNLSTSISLDGDTDLYVYDNDGNIVATVTDNEVVQCHDTSLTILNGNSNKTLLFPSDKQYNMEFVSKNNGNIDYRISEYDGDNISREVDFYSIPVVTDQVISYSSSIKDGEEKVDHSLTTNNNIVECNYDSNVNTCNALEHEYDNWENIVEATDEKTGIKYRKCKSCGYIEKSCIPILPASAEIFPNDINYPVNCTINFSFNLFTKSGEKTSLIDDEVSWIIIDSSVEGILDEKNGIFVPEKDSCGVFKVALSYDDKILGEASIYYSNDSNMTMSKSYDGIDYGNRGMKSCVADQYQMLTNENASDIGAEYAHNVFVDGSVGGGTMTYLSVGPYRMFDEISNADTVDLNDSSTYDDRYDFSYIAYKVSPHEKTKINSLSLSLYGAIWPSNSMGKQQMAVYVVDNFVMNDAGKIDLTDYKDNCVKVLGGSEFQQFYSSDSCVSIDCSDVLSKLSTTDDIYIVIVLLCSGYFCGIDNSRASGWGTGCCIRFTGIDISTTEKICYDCLNEHNVCRWLIDDAASFENDGKKHGFCEVCGLYIEEAIPRMSEEIVTENRCNNVTSSIMSKTIVKENTIIELFTDTEEAEIYYTLDGSDPYKLDNPSRMKYSQPIVISNDMFIIAYACKTGMVNSYASFFSFGTYSDYVLTLVDNSSYLLSNLYVSNVAINTTVRSIMLQFCNQNITISSSDGTIIDSIDDKVCTGYVLNLAKDNNVIDKRTIIVSGDTYCDGEIDIFDILAMVNYLNGDEKLDDISIEAGLIVSEEEIDIFDILAMVNYLNGDALLPDKTRMVG